jgi:dTDP-4-amino-4,6-dideoxygalactose transaminase/lipopolysaccharide/colanic/teichoic acid biosynthesis glycosyltransferase
VKVEHTSKRQISSLNSKLPNGIKRTLDLIASGAGIVMFLPLLAIIAIAIKLDSQGPIVFSQRRVGRHMSHFNIYKFRTMRANTPDLPTDQMLKLPSPVTRIGRFLRRTSLDELPQLFNVLLGQMSLVGPRPALYNQHDLIAARDALGVHQCLPGITGWAQINGREELTAPEKVEFDRWYVEHFSIGLDLKILWLTFFSLFSNRGVYYGSPLQRRYQMFLRYSRKSYLSSALSIERPLVPKLHPGILACNGGVPVRANPMPMWPSFAQDEIDAVTAVLQSGQVNYWSGDEGRSFEREFAAATGCAHAVAVANGTVALELALRALEIGPGDEVVTPSRTFIASASCAVMCGATPVMADIDPISQNLTAETIRAVLSPRTRAIIAVHLAGWPCDMDPILRLAKEHGLKVIEDCAQAQGATYKGRAVGSIGDVGAFSFCRDKIITTGGEGGMVTTQDTALWERAWSFKDHGKSYEAVYRREHPPGYRWLHESFGTNWRLTEMQSAIGRVALRKLPQWLDIRRRNARRLSECFSQFPALRTTLPSAESHHAYYTYYVFVRPEKLQDEWSRDRIMAALNAEGIPCFSGSCSEIYLEKAFPQEMRPPHRLPIAKELGETALMFMVHPNLTEADIEDVCQAVEKMMAVAGKP